MKKYRTKEEKIEALKKSVSMRERWIEAVKLGVPAEEMAKMGIRTLPIGK